MPKSKGSFLKKIYSRSELETAVFAGKSDVDFTGELKASAKKFLVRAFTPNACPTRYEGETTTAYGFKYGVGQEALDAPTECDVAYRPVPAKSKDNTAIIVVETRKTTDTTRGFQVSTATDYASYDGNAPEHWQKVFDLQTP